MKTIQIIISLSCIVSYCFGQSFNRLQKVDKQKRDTVFLIKEPYLILLDGVWKTKMIRELPFFLVHIEGGTFTMATTEAENVVHNEKPNHTITLNDFYISNSEVSYNEFHYFLNKYGSDKIKKGFFKGQKIIHQHDLLRKKEGQWVIKKGFGYHPVTHVTWYGAQEYCHWLSEKTGQNYYLPTEAQWEYAAKGGKYGIDDNFTYSGSNRLDSIAWFNENSKRRITPSPIRRRLSNQLGIYDMSGNVWEWCADWNKGNYKEKGASKESSNNNIKIFRGGSWVNNPEYCSVTYRSKSGPSFASNNLGFRIARDVNTNFN